MIFFTISTVLGHISSRLFSHINHCWYSITKVYLHYSKSLHRIWCLHTHMSNKNGYAIIKSINARPRRYNRVYCKIISRSPRPKTAIHGAPIKRNCICTLDITIVYRLNEIKNKTKILTSEMQTNKQTNEYQLRCVILFNYS